MRRARIKAVATVPVRRKVAQEATPAASAEPPAQTDAKEPEKLPDNNEPSNSKSVTVDTQENTVATLDVPQSSQNTPVFHVKTDQESEAVLKAPPISPVKEKESSRVSVQHNQDEKAPISPLKEKEPLTVSKQDNQDEVDSQNNLQLSHKIDSSQKPATAPVEATPVKTLQSRSHFMRPTPRLDGSGRIRRNSVHGSGASASESEDDSRRSNSIIPNRVRNDSICSTLSLKDTGNVGNLSKLNLGQKRRMVVSESARKLAEARREFLLKHENQPPDKAKLTMYDLIYYNPVTNPMKPKPVANRPAAARKNSVCSIPDKKEEEIVDEPEEMLVPQVKIGPNGQLIIDEQSLVIDQYKAQENIDRSDILVDDDTSTGFYKRRSKSKDWSKWETLKFYKALNTYGTDFLLMSSVFPQRTRQELKLKYKKEEKINHGLVEKALVYQEFDTEALEKDLAKVEENERLESESNKKGKEKKKKDKKRKRTRCLQLSEEINCEDDPNSDTNKNSAGEEQSSEEEEKIEKPAPKKRRAPRKRKAIVSETNSSNESVANDSDSNPESYEIQTTRSGRTSRKVKKSQKPKRTPNTKTKGKATKDAKMNDKQNNNDQEITSEMEVQNSHCNEDSGTANTVTNENTKDNPAAGKQNAVENKNETLKTAVADSNIATLPNEFSDMSNIEALKPGSWVVLTKDSSEEPGKKIIEHYVVGPNYNANDPHNKDNFIPIKLPADVLKTVTNCIQNIEPEDNT